MTTQDNKQDIFGSSFCLNSHGDGWERYELLPHIGRGTMTLYHIFPGVQVVFQHFQAKSCFSSTAAVLPHVIEINYCQSGRYECELPGRTFVYMGPRDVVINPLSNQMRASSFPLEEYTGTALLLYLEEMRQKKEYYSFIGIDLEVFQQRCCHLGQCQIFRGDSSLCTLFESMTDKMDQGLMRLRVLNVISWLCEKEERAGSLPAYYPRWLIDSVKASRNELLSASERIPLSDLAANHGLSRRALIDGFRGVYGETPYAYVRQYRMQEAAAQLIGTRTTISQIAADAGYQNASKFSKAFRMVMGISPSNYRKINCTAGASSAPVE